MEHYFQPANNFRYRKATRHGVFKCEYFEKNSVSILYSILYSPYRIILLRLLTSELLTGRELLDKLVSLT